jgi:hypothetical protein
VIVPLEIVTVWPDVTETESRMISEADVPTVSPDTMTVPALFLSSAFAAVPDAEAATDSGVPLNVRTEPETVPGVVLSAMVANTPVAPESDDVPMTKEPAVADPVDAAAVLVAIKSATSCIRLVLRVEEYVTDISYLQ